MDRRRTQSAPSLASSAVHERIRSALLALLVLLTLLGGATIRVDVAADECCAEGQCCCQESDTGCCGAGTEREGPVLIAGCGCGHGGAHFVGPGLPRAVRPVPVSATFVPDPRTWIVSHPHASPRSVDLETEEPVPRVARGTTRT